MISAVTEGLTTVIGWVGTVITALTAESGELSALLPLLAIGVSVTVISMAIGTIRSFTWGA